MKLNTINVRKKSSGFTLIEMIGVLAVIAILAALLVPKIFESINNARVNNAAVTCGTVKTAVADHYAKFGALYINGAATPPVALTAAQATAFDKVLLSEGFLDKPFAVKIGDGLPSDATHTRVQVVAGLASTATPGATDAAYNLDGDATATPANDASGSWVVEAVITGVTPEDAKELNDRIDGPNLGAALNAADLVGRVKFAAIAAGTTGEVHIYLTHR